MSTGPIEFARSPNVDTLGETEYGGEAGLVQHGPADQHLAHLTTEERRGILVRAQSSVTDVAVVDEDGATLIRRTINATGIDPVTGLDVVANVQSEEVTSDSVKPVL
jgi:hypothetical protein